MSASPPVPDYLHGASEEEHERLELMNGLLNRRALDELHLEGGERVLELGAGTAIFARAMADVLPRGSVLGIERDARQLAGARRRAEGATNLELRQGDAAVPPLAEDEQGSFDVVHARFLLEHVADPLAVVRAMVRAARPGGRIVLVDDDHSLLRLWPEPDGLPDLWELYYRTFGTLGLDPLVGKKLVQLLDQAGARPRYTSILYYGAASGEPAFHGVVENLARVLEGVGERLVGTGEISLDDFHARIARLREWGACRGHWLCYGLPWAEGTR